MFSFSKKMSCIVKLEYFYMFHSTNKSHTTIVMFVVKKEEGYLAHVYYPAFLVKVWIYKAKKRGLAKRSKYFDHNNIQKLNSVGLAWKKELVKNLQAGS
jgi:hypothetical protein